MSMIGKSLAHYSIISQIGKGGMGEVYQAKDQKLGRDVAIKVLPEEFAWDAERVARFQREAKLLASLNHPNIAAIHGLEEADGKHFLVLELIEGQTLAERIKGGPVPLEEALKLGLQIAEALEAAHEKGVIHRDLKPANIKITPDGKVKVLDFGLAKAYAGDPEDVNLSNSPTLSDAATRQGVILGTSAYMPPEQAKGKTVDKRADIWSFGVVLFEMLSGRQLFTGETVSETLASVIKSEPEWQSLPPNLHPRIRLLLERCLKKEPKDRYSGISDARVDIQEVLADPKGVFAQPATAESGPKSKQTLVWASITVILIIVAIAVIWNMKTRKPLQISELEFTLPADREFRLNEWGGVALAVSPDGGQFVYATTRGLYVRSVGHSDNRPISGSDNNADSPFFSPDGRWVGYYSPADRKLKKIAVNGGMPRPLCDIETSLAGAQWLPDNTIILSLFPGGIFKIPDDGGTPEPLFGTDSAESAENAGFPILAQVLPDGENVLFTNLIDGQNKHITIQSLETGERIALFSGQGASYYSTGHIIYTETNGTKILAVPFDLDRLEVTGGAVPIMEGVIGASLSESGTFAYVLNPDSTPLPDSEAGSADSAGRTLWWVDKNGREEQIELPLPYINYGFPAISPDGNFIALTDHDPALKADIWIFDLIRETMSRLTQNEMDDRVAVWSPDSKRIAYSAMGQIVTEGGVTAIVQQAVNGSGEPEYLFSSPGKILFPFSWNKAKNVILMTDVDTAFENPNIGMLSVEGDRPYTLLLHESYAETSPQLSPDGRWLTYISNENDPNVGQIYVRSFPEVDEVGRIQISTDGGTCPRWSPDGKKLYYLIGDEIAEAVMVVEIETEPTFNPGKPEILFQGKYLGPVPDNGTPYDIHPDGDRFLMIKPPFTTGLEANVTGPRKINISLNWFKELNERAPVD